MKITVHLLNKALTRGRVYSLCTVVRNSTADIQTDLIYNKIRIIYGHTHYALSLEFSPLYSSGESRESGTLYNNYHPYPDFRRPEYKRQIVKFRHPFRLFSSPVS